MSLEVKGQTCLIVTLVQCIKVTPSTGTGSISLLKLQTLLKEKEKNYKNLHFFFHPKDMKNNFQTNNFYDKDDLI